RLLHAEDHGPHGARGAGEPADGALRREAGVRGQSGGLRARRAASVMRPLVTRVNDPDKISRFHSRNPESEIPLSDSPALVAHEPQNKLPELSIDQLPPALKAAAEHAGWTSL